MSADPKGEAGKLKCPMHLLPPCALQETAWVHGLGARKYGAWNWRENRVEAMTYVGAMLRHLMAWVNGEDADPESGLSHLAHVAAGCNIVMDARQAGMLVDNRPGSVAMGDGVDAEDLRQARAEMLAAVRQAGEMGGLIRAALADLGCARGLEESDTAFKRGAMKLLEQALRVGCVDQRDGVDGSDRIDGGVVAGEVKGGVA